MVWRMAVVAPDMATSTTYFSQPRRAEAVVFSHHEALQRSGLRDHAGPTDGGADIGDAAHDCLIAQDRPQQVVLLHAILERDDARLRSHDWKERTGCTLGVPQFDAEHHQVHRADGPGIVGHIDLGQMYRLRTAFDGKAARPHGGKMCSARNEMDIGAPLREPRAEIAADPTGAHDRNSQGPFSPRFCQCS
jgi:hypothetical protein